jgi:hypothetical protein
MIVKGRLLYDQQNDALLMGSRFPIDFEKVGVAWSRRVGTLLAYMVYDTGESRTVESRKAGSQEPSLTY